MSNNEALCFEGLPLLDDEHYEEKENHQQNQNLHGFHD